MLMVIIMVITSMLSSSDRGAIVKRDYAAGVEASLGYRTASSDSPSDVTIAAASSTAIDVFHLDQRSGLGSRAASWSRRHNLAFIVGAIHLKLAKSRWDSTWEASSYPLGASQLLHIVRVKAMRAMCRLLSQRLVVLLGINAVASLTSWRWACTCRAERGRARCAAPTARGSRAPWRVTCWAWPGAVCRCPATSSASRQSLAD